MQTSEFRKLNEFPLIHEIKVSKKQVLLLFVWTLLKIKFYIQINARIKRSSCKTLDPVSFETSYSTGRTKDARRKLRPKI